MQNHDTSDTITENKITQKCFLVNLTNTQFFAIEICDHQIKEIIYFNDSDHLLSFLTNHHTAVVLHSQIHNQVWIPESLLDEKNAHCLLQYVPLLEKQKIYQYPIAKFDTISFFTAQQHSLIEKIEALNLPKTIVIDQISAVLTQCNLQQNGLYLHFDAKGMVAILIEQEKLQLAKHFACNNSAELQYFINLIFKEFHIQVKKPNIYISGTNEQITHLQSQLSDKYNIILPHESSEYPIDVAHLFKFYQCALSEEN